MFEDEFNPNPAPLEEVEEEDTGPIHDIERITFSELLKNVDPISRRALTPLQKYVEMPDIRGIIINKPEEIVIEMPNGDWKFFPDPLLTEELLLNVARCLANLAGQIYTPDNPILSCKMPGGHRVQIISGFNTPSKFCMAVRMQRDVKFSINDYGLSQEDIDKVIDSVTNRRTILISGGTSSGKTSFMNALLPYIPDDERLITLEDVPELKVPHKNWTPLLFANNDTGFGNQDITDLLNACLRLRPDRIILGEIRKENAFTFCSAINTGHEGSMATIHANTPKLAVDAVINRVLLNGDAAESTIMTLRRQLVNDIYGVVQLNRHAAHVKGYFVELPKSDDSMDALGI